MRDGTVSLKDAIEEPLEVLGGLMAGLHKGGGGWRPKLKIERKALDLGGTSGRSPYDNFVACRMPCGDS